MDALLFGSSALHAVRSLRTAGAGLASLASRQLGAPPTISRLLELIAADPTSSVEVPTSRKPLRLVVPSPRMRSSTPRIRYHVCTRPLPPGSMLQAMALSDGRDSILLPSASLLTIDLASALIAPTVNGDMPYAEAVLRTTRLVMELCGSYAHDPDNPRFGESACGLEPYSSLGELETQLTRMPNLAGIGYARKALRLAAGGSASPMESLVYGLFCLPSNLGGFGLHGAELNYAVIHGSTTFTAHANMHGDVVWPQEKVAIEYQGRGAHDLSEQTQLKEESRRIQDYQSLGYEVYPVTWEDLASGASFERFALCVASALFRGGRKNALRRMRQLLKNPDFKVAQTRLKAIFLGN